LVNPAHGSGFLTKEQAAEYCSSDKIQYLELKAGEVALLHNWLLHGSDVNRTDIPRRAFQRLLHGRPHQGEQRQKFTTVFGEGALTVDQFSAVTAR